MPNIGQSGTVSHKYPQHSFQYFCNLWKKYHQKFWFKKIVKLPLLEHKLQVNWPEIIINSDQLGYHVYNPSSATKLKDIHDLVTHTPLIFQISQLDSAGYFFKGWTSEFVEQIMGLVH